MNIFTHTSLEPQCSDVKHLAMLGTQSFPHKFFLFNIQHFSHRLSNNYRFLILDTRLNNSDLQTLFQCTEQYSNFQRYSSFTFYFINIKLPYLSCNCIFIHKNNVSKFKLQKVLAVYKLLCKQTNKPIRSQSLLGLLRLLKNMMNSDPKACQAINFSRMISQGYHLPVCRFFLFFPLENFSRKTSPDDLGILGLVIS